MSRDRAVGWLALTGSLALGVVVASDHTDVGSIRFGLTLWALAWVGWVVMVRPSLAIDGDRVILTNSLRDVVIPAATVTEVDLRAYLRVSAGGRTYASAAVGAPRGRQRMPRASARIVVDGSFVADRIREVATHARGVTSGADSTVVERWAVGPLVTLAALCAAALATLAF